MYLQIYDNLNHTNPDVYAHIIIHAQIHILYTYNHNNYKFIHMSYRLEL